MRSQASVVEALTTYYHTETGKFKHKLHVLIDNARMKSIRKNGGSARNTCRAIADLSAQYWEITDQRRTLVSQAGYSLGGLREGRNHQKGAIKV